MERNTWLLFKLLDLITSLFLCLNVSLYAFLLETAMFSFWKCTVSGISLELEINKEKNVDNTRKKLRKACYFPIDSLAERSKGNIFIIYGE